MRPLPLKHSKYAKITHYTGIHVIRERINHTKLLQAVTDGSKEKAEEAIAPNLSLYTRLFVVVYRLILPHNRMLYLGRAMLITRITV